MKIFLSVFFLLLIPFPVFAGFYYDNDFRYIEPTKNFLYISVGEAKNNKIGSKIKNVALVNLNTNEISYIFDDDFEENIIDIIFESRFDPDEESIEFNLKEDSYRAKRLFLNNSQVPNRPLKDKICILTHHPKKHLYSLWFCDKSGQNLKQVKTIFANTVWWFDVKNDKICFVRQIKDRIQYESIEW